MAEKKYNRKYGWKYQGAKLGKTNSYAVQSPNGGVWYAKYNAKRHTRDYYDTSGSLKMRKKINDHYYGTYRQPKGEGENQYFARTIYRKIR